MENKKHLKIKSVDIPEAADATVKEGDACVVYSEKRARGERRVRQRRVAFRKQWFVRRTGFCWADDNYNASILGGQTFDTKGDAVMFACAILAAGLEKFDEDFRAHAAKAEYRQRMVAGAADESAPPPPSLEVMELLNRRKHEVLEGKHKGRVYAKCVFCDEWQLDLPTEKATGVRSAKPRRRCERDAQTDPA